MLTSLSAWELADLLARREVSAREVAQAHLDRIQRLDDQVGAFLYVDPEATLAEAERAQQILEGGIAGPLTGVPIAIKDNLSTKDVPTSCASRILEGYVPPFDATVVAQVKSQGLVSLGKTNLDEFAMGTSTENSAFRVTKNPWDLGRSPGGSSGGSAAAVAAGFAPLSLGSDTGGSIRMPAALCGLVGYKPTYGRSSRFGLVAFGSSLDQVGPFARNVRDAALLANAITGHDPSDGTSLPVPPVTPKLERASLKGARIGVPEELLSQDVSPGVREVFESALQLLRHEGAIVEAISLPSLKLAVTTYYIIAPAEASSNLARFDGVRYGPRVDAKGHVQMVEKTRGRLFGHEVKARIMIGTYALSAGYYDAYYAKAQAVRALMRRELEQAFHRFDLIASPTSPITAFKLGELNHNPLALKLLDLCTIPANMAGIPALSLNCGFSETMPVGLQLMAPKMNDEALLELAFAAERCLPVTGMPNLDERMP